MKRTRATTIHDQLGLFQPSPRVKQWEGLPPDAREEVIVLLSQLLLGASSEETASVKTKEQLDE